MGTGGLRTPRVPDELAPIQLDFLPFNDGSLGARESSSLWIEYSCQELASEVRLGQPREIRFDPRDISQAYILTARIRGTCCSTT